MLTPKIKHTEFKDHSCGNVEPVQSRGDHVSPVASPRKHEDEACGSPRDTRGLTLNWFRVILEEPPYEQIRNATENNKKLRNIKEKNNKNINETKTSERRIIKIRGNSHEALFSSASLAELGF